MKIAIPFDRDNGMIGQHFGKSPFFKIYNVQNDVVVGDVVVPMEAEGHDAIAGFLSAVQMDVVLCGGIGGDARQALAAKGIAVIPGIVGKADAAVKAFLSDTLRPASHGACGYACGDHDCGHEHEHGCSGCAHHAEV